MLNRTVTSLLAALLLSGLGSAGFSTEPSPPDAQLESNTVVETIDFINDLVPMFTKLGCNAGKCHGSAIGRGGFKLSLYGGTPESDYDAITRRQGGRRINLADPESSLVFTKPAEIVEHGGGEVLSGVENAELLITWIEQGAQLISHRKLKHIEVHPARFLASRVDDETTMKVLAHYHDGSTRDVTNLTRFTADDSSAVKINSNTATAKVLRTGRHIVIARYSTEVTPIEFVAPVSETASELSQEPRNNFVDDEILAALSELHLPASPILDDHSFLRRITLDLTGRLPEYRQQNTTFAVNREEVIDDLLSSEQFVSFYALKLAKLLRIQSKQDKNVVTTTPEAARAFHDYLAKQLRDGTGYDRMARQIITASGDSSQYGPAAFFTAAEPLREV